MSQAVPESPATPGPRLEDARLRPARKAVYAGGDFTVNVVLSALNLVYVTYFLTLVAGLRPELAGLVQLIGRAVDAFTDPAMGRISDRCRWRWGRRRPFFLIGALPFGATFALLWTTPGGSQAELFAYYTALYVALSLSMTVLSVPYLALLPEMALGYDARTSFNAYRNYGSVIGICGAVAFRPVAEALGGGPEGFAAAGVLYGLLVSAPWLGAWLASWERPDFQRRESRIGMADGLRLLLRHRSFRKLTGLYLCSRIAMDVIGAMLILYATYVMGRSGDFEIIMGLFLGGVLLSLPVWIRISTHYDKAQLFLVGAVWWLLSCGLILVGQPDWPRWVLLAFGPVAAVGFAVVDLMAWSMLGDVVDEDELITGERREGIYNGAFMFIRKLGGSVAVFLALALLGAVGFEKDFEKNAGQSDAVVLAIRLLTALGPALFLAISIWFARGYTLTREAHDELRARLAERDAKR